MKTPVIERFDRTAEAYLRWWAPVLAPASKRLVDRLDRLDPGLPAGRPSDVLDLGCGTGNLIFEATRRWPEARLTGLDGSVGMLKVIRRESAALPESTQARLAYVHAYADSLPFPDASFDLVMTAFVLQQVPDRMAVIREMHRVLRPGGVVAIYGWLKATGDAFAPDTAFEDSLAEACVAGAPDTDNCAGHYRSVRSSADELRTAGFRHVSPRADTLEHAWSIDALITYRTTTRELALFEAMAETTRRQVLDSLMRRLQLLTADQMVDRPPVVSILARKA
ncbi:MAG TPA: methyltransferase domain-containing protein [Candidatus Limnocylindrales bacterium]